MFTLPDLPYAYDALGDNISADIMRLHHDKHHRTYVDKLNAAIEPYPELAGRTVESLLRGLDQLPEPIRAAVRNHGGGHYNHSLFWQWMSPQGGGAPTGDVATLIDQAFGSYDAFKEQFSAKALSVFGSGWVWLLPDMTIMTTPNQDTPIALGLDEPLLGLDVWEHAYYLDYKNKRDDYVAAWWHVVNWEFVSQRLVALGHHDGSI